MREFTTPMMKQYMGIKKAYQDCLLFFRAGDFYELFLEDAFIGSKILNITLTHKRGGKDGNIPMAGVPYHAVDSYLAKLVRAGHKVAICEQVSLPSKYGIIDREVIRVVTPGTVLDEKALEKKENNYIISLFIENNILAIASADISTGYFSAMQIPYQNLNQTIQNELSKIHPAECLLPQDLYNNPEILKILRVEKGLNISFFKDWYEYADNAKEFLKDHFGLKTLASFDMEDKSLALQTAAVLLGYLKSTQKTTVGHIKKILTHDNDDCMNLDRSTMINLELFSTIRDHDIRGTLISILDQTETAMGGRLLKQWMKKPLQNKEEIIKRHEGVDEFFSHSQERFMLRESLRAVVDIERILSRLSVNLGNARDLVSLKISLKTILVIKNLLKERKASLLKNLYENISPKIATVIDIIEKNILDEPRIELKTGGIIKTGVSRELDSLRKTVGGNKDWILQMERKERERTGISSLKVRFNQVFGFYIEVSKANLHSVPKNYIRKQTLVNAERFITHELKEHEEIILTAEEKINMLEYKLYTDVLEQVLVFTKDLQCTSESIAVVDCIASFAEIAEKNNYVRAKILDSGEFKIIKGRHPVVEKLLEDIQFVPNDTILNSRDQKLLLITGPNMAGKSVYIRQAALMVLMNQIGCFIPAESADLSIADKIFVRSGASDVITSGLSTFMVEMVETAYILHQATKNSLIVMDEIGRGTSTYDGISIAWAVASYLVTHFKISPKVLFATHYHELQKLQEEYPDAIKNFHMSVIQDKGEPVFLHTLLPEGASHSFGVAVAKLAGIPEEVIQNAKDMLNVLEKRGEETQEKIIEEPLDEAIADKLLHKELENIDILQMTPLEALNKLAQLKEKLKMLQENQGKFLEAD